jgi:hypothetical protein
MSHRRKNLSKAEKDSLLGHLKECFGHYHFEMERYSDRKKILLISGVQNIMSYTTEEVTLNMGGEFLSISGRGLLCRTYVNKTVEVIGEIGGISSDFRVPVGARES